MTADFCKPAAVVLAVAALAGCGQGPLACDGPEQCGGNACCFDLPLDVNGLGPDVYCTGSPDACLPKTTVSTLTTRLCETDADCVAGGISTVWPYCCPSSVNNHAAKTCGGPCHRPGD